MTNQSNSLRCCPLPLGWQKRFISTLCIVIAAMFTLVATAQEPFPAPPQVYIDTTWNPPTQGNTWTVNSSSTFQSVLNTAQPGDIIVLNSSVSGNFTLPNKTNPNNQWIYIESSALANLPPPGTRVGPSDAPNMARITTTNTTSPINLAPGANHYRLIGLEITSNSTRGGNPGSNPPTNNFTYCLICWSPALGLAEPDSITVDRSYIHGSDTQDVGEGIQANGSNFAVIDSYISDIHESTFDSQAILAYWTPGPIKIVNNFLSATTEDVMFGGAGGYNNPYVPSDIEIRRNHFFKPLAWDSCGVHGTVGIGQKLANGTLCTMPHQWDEKNNLEFKSAQRVIVTGNIFENTWVAGQTGSSVLFTIRTSQSGNVAVVDDINFQSNIITGADSGFGTLEQDNYCGAAWGYPNCTNPGESRRIWMDNNLLLLSPNLDTWQHYWVAMDAGNATHPGLTDYIFQHNTVLMIDYSNMPGYIFKLSQLYGCSPTQPSPTHNIWILDNAITRQPTGDCGFEGTTGLNIYMGDPAPVAPRFYGNVMFVPLGDKVYAWPSGSDDATTTPFTYVNPSNGNYQLLIPDWVNTTDGNVSGIDYNELQQAMNP